MDGYAALALCLETITIATGHGRAAAEDFGDVDVVAEVTRIMERIEARGEPTQRDARRLEEIALAVEKWPAEDC